MENMQLSDQAQAQSANPTEMSASPAFPVGESISMKSTAKLEPETKLLQELSEELANLLVLYKKAGGSLSALTLPPGKEVCGSRHIIVLPADIDDKGVFSLKEQ